jgi:hypothetical protein
MREDKDNSAKWMIDHHGDVLLRLGRVTGFASWRAAQTTLAHPRQLQDGLLEVTFPGQQTPHLCVIEVATYPERRAEEQAARDAMMVLLDRGVLPDVITLVLHPRGELRIREEWQITSRTGGTRLSGHSTVVEMWTRSAADLLAMNDVGAIPLVPLAETTESPEALVRQRRERIDRQARPEERENLLAVTQVMTRLRYNDPGLLTILGGRQVMIESPLLQEYAKEIAKESVQDVLLHVLRTKFGTVPPEHEARIRAIQVKERLRDLVSQVVLSPDLDAFQAHLASQ